MIAVAWCVVLLLSVSVVADPRSVRAAPAAPVSECLPTTQQLNAAFDLAGIGRLGAGYPHLPRIGVDSAIVPPVILRAIAWIESNWQQFDSSSLPLLSPDYGYGVMQITSGMAGASGIPGALSLKTQSRVGGDYLYNIAYAARLLAVLFKEMPKINTGDPTVLENWYYAIWAYNGWGWSNNPNNPAFTRLGTPASNPATFPYQERVFYLVQHPPLDANGHPLWRATRVTLPKASAIGNTPGPITTASTHQAEPQVYGATYDVPSTLTEVRANASTQVHVTVYNTSGVAWEPVGDQPVFGLMYHWVKPVPVTDPRYDPNLGGYDVLDSEATPVAADIPVGGSDRLAVSMRAPTAAGKYLLDWDMWSRSAGWFSYSSVPPGMQTVTVVPANQQVPPYSEPPPPNFMKGNHAELVTTMANDTPKKMHPGQPYSRTVLLFNPGTSGWGRNYSVEEMGTSVQQSLPMSFVGACRTVPLTISGVAPSAAGSYKANWRLASAAGHFFGPAFTFKFMVSSGK